MVCGERLGGKYIEGGEQGDDVAVVNTNFNVNMISERNENPSICGEISNQSKRKILTN